MDIRKSVSIIITNNNGRHLLEECLPYTLEAIKKAGVDFEIIIVDDCSTDGSVQFITNYYTDVTLITNAETRGFPHCCNKGIQLARCQLILLLDPGIKLSPDYFEQQWKYFLGWKTFGVMGRVMKNDDRIVYAARMPGFSGLKIETDYSFYTASSSNRLLTFYLSHTNALIDAAKLKKTGGFNELFSDVYCEDMELSIRAWRVKWKCYYEHESVCWQQLSNTFSFDKALPARAALYSNLLYLHIIHLNGWSLRAWYFQILFFDLLPALFTGKKFMLKGFTQLRANHRVIQEYKDRVKQLMIEFDSQTNLFSVVGKLSLSVSNKKIIKVGEAGGLTDV